MLALCRTTLGNKSSNKSSIATVSSIVSSPRGLEPEDVTNCIIKQLRNSVKASDAESDALLAKTDRTAKISLETRQIVEAWPKLPEAVKAGILAMVRVSLDD